MMERYIIRKLSTPDVWECTDTANGLICTFEQSKFNETQKFIFSSAQDIAACEVAEKIAKIANDMASWLRTHHYHLVMPYSNDAARISIALLIIAKRKELNLTQIDLAEKCGLDRSHISRIEQGRYNITIDVMGKIANAFGCHMAFVSNGDEEQV